MRESQCARDVDQFSADSVGSGYASYSAPAGLGVARPTSKETGVDVYFPGWWDVSDTIRFLLLLHFSPGV